MEKTKDYTKKYISVTPDGHAVTDNVVYLWDRTEENIRNDIRDLAQFYGGSPDIQSVVECNARHLLSIMYRSGTVKIISYTEQ